MSLDDIDKIPRTAEEIREALEPIAMPYELAVRIDSDLKAFATLVGHAKANHADEIRELKEIIEGLLAAWPHTEIIDHYNPSHSYPVLMKDEALKRAARAVVRV